MPNNEQNRDFQNQDFYSSVNQNSATRDNSFGQVQPNTPPYGEPRRYDSSQQPYQSSQVYPAYNRPQSAQSQNNNPYSGGYGAPPQGSQPFPGYSGLKPPPQGNQQKSVAPIVNPYGGTAKKMYSSSAYNDGDTVYEAFRPKNRSKRIVLIVSIIILLAAMGIGAYFLFFKDKGGSSSSNDKKSVPAAVTEATSYEKPVHTTEAPSEEETDPVSLGDLVETPDVVGLNMRISKVKLEEAGFRVKFNQIYCDTIDADEVIGQNISPNTKVPLDTEITLTVSKGPEPETNIEVPSVKDLPYSEASDKLMGLGFSVELEFINSSSVKKDRIVSQSIPSGTQAPKGSRIVLVVSKGNETPAIRTGTVNTKETALNIRKSPSTEAEIVGTADKGEKVEVVGEDGDWYLIKYKKISGYAAKEFIKLA